MNRQELISSIGSHARHIVAELTSVGHLVTLDKVMYVLMSRYNVGNFHEILPPLPGSAPTSTWMQVPLLAYLHDIDTKV